MHEEFAAPIVGPDQPKGLVKVLGKESGEVCGQALTWLTYRMEGDEHATTINISKLRTIDNPRLLSQQFITIPSR